tara:strand:- start:6208 stop:6357 length:150 start_codon:yes stop_codon:yes gene_type:complete
MEAISFKGPSAEIKQLILFMPNIGLASMIIFMNIFGLQQSLKIKNMMNL